MPDVLRNRQGGIKGIREVGRRGWGGGEREVAVHPGPYTNC